MRPETIMLSDASEKNVVQRTMTAAAPRFFRFILGPFMFAVVMLGSLGLVEVGLRALAPQSIVPRYVEASAYGIRKNIAHVRGAMQTSDFQHAFATNSQGFRGSREYSIEKPSGVLRVIVLGDSVTLGHGVSDNETFSSVAERALSRRRTVEVINMGVSGFGTAEELIQLKEIGFGYHPDLVVLAYFPNDPYNNMVSQLFSVEDGRLVRAKESFTPALFVRDHLSEIPGYSFLCQHSHVVNFIRARLSAFFMDRLGRQNQTSTEIRSDLTPGERMLTEALLQEVYRVTWAERRVPLIVLNIPVVLGGRLIQNFPSQGLGRESEAVEVIDIAQTVYRGLGMDDLSYRHDSHPKPMAHELIGEELARVIERHFERLAIRNQAGAAGV